MWTSLWSSSVGGGWTTCKTVNSVRALRFLDFLYQTIGVGEHTVRPFQGNFTFAGEAEESLERFKSFEAQLQDGE